MRLVLSIDLGNDAMLKPGYVARALRDVARLLSERIGSFGGNQEGRILDASDNIIGKWEVIDQPAQPQVKTVWALAIDGNHIGTEASIFTSELKLYEHLAEAMDPTDEERETIGAYVAANDAAGLANFVTETMEVPDLFTYSIDSMDL